MLFQAEPLYKLFTKMRHSTKRHTHTQNSSHITQNLSQITQNLSHIHDMQTSLYAFSSLPTLEAVYENDP